MHVCISTMQFDGAGGFVHSEGTTLEKAVNNQMLRQAITSEQDVVACYKLLFLKYNPVKWCWIKPGQRNTSRVASITDCWWLTGCKEVYIMVC